MYLSAEGWKAIARLSADQTESYAFEKFGVTFTSGGCYCFAKALKDFGGDKIKVIGIGPNDKKIMHVVAYNTQMDRYIDSVNVFTKSQLCQYLQFHEGISTRFFEEIHDSSGLFESEKLIDKIRSSLISASKDVDHW